MSAAEYPLAHIAAGVMTASGSGLELDNLDDDQLTEHIDAALNASTIWIPAEMVAPEVPTVDLHPVARWADPGILQDDDAARLEAITNKVISRRIQESSAPTAGSMPAVRLLVREALHAQQLSKLEFSIDDRYEMPMACSIEADTRSLSWGWPLDVVLAGGPDTWLKALRDSPFHPNLYEVRRAGASMEGGSETARDYDGPEILIIDGSVDPRETLTGDLKATCIIVAGDVEPTDDNLRDYVQQFGAAITILMPGDPDRWWHKFFDELCHDKPADVAAAMANRKSLVALPSVGAEFTAAATWLVAAGTRHPKLAALARRMKPGDYLHEDWASREARDVAVVLTPRPKVSIGRELERASIGAESPRKADRHLIANVVDDSETSIRKALPPQTDLRLLVKIAVPDETTDNFDPSAPAPDLPESDRPTKLEVTVISDLWPEAQIQEIVLATAADRRLDPSTTAVFDFTTPASGRVCLFDITIFHKNRPIQAASLQAVVRSKPLSSDRPEVVVRVLSGPNEPDEEASAADVYLDLRDNQVRDRKGTPLVAAGSSADYLDLYDRDFSKVLGQDDAPTAWSDDEGRDLLIKMAKHGALFHAQFKTIAGLADAKWVELRVLPGSAPFPIELMYLGAAPNDDAKLCHHVRRPRKKAVPCIQKSGEIVCPYGFLGVSSVISRTIDGEPRDEVAIGGGARRVQRPTRVLYAATERADVGSAQPKPSNRVETTAGDLFDDVDRVSSWPDWCASVAALAGEPSILIVLGHTQQVDNRVQLHIGKNSVLDQAMITDAYVRGGSDQPASPIVVLMACSSSLASTGPFQTLPASFVLYGAASVIATLSKVNGAQAATATEAFLRAVVEIARTGGRLSEAITLMRRNLVKQGLPASLVVIANGDIDIKLEA